MITSVKYFMPKAASIVAAVARANSAAGATLAIIIVTSDAPRTRVAWDHKPVGRSRR